MDVTGTTAKMELTASADLTSVNVTGSASIGTPSKTIPYNSNPDVCYSLALQIADGETLTLYFSLGDVSGSTAGSLQLFTLIVNGTISTAGSIVVTFVSLLTGTIILNVPVLLADNADAVGGKIRTALLANSTITDNYTIAGSDNTITAESLFPVNDDTLDLNYANGTAAGLTAGSTSSSTAVIPSKAYRINGMEWDTTDFQGVTLPDMTKLYSVLIQTASVGAVIENDDGTNTAAYPTPKYSLESYPDGNHPWAGDPVTFAASGADVFLTIDIQAGE